MDRRDGTRVRVDLAGSTCRLVSTHHIHKRTARRRIQVRSGNRGGPDLASVLVHEEWHVTHGGDEAGAYAAQLITLAYLGSGPGHPTYYDVSLSMRVALRGQKGR